jgi:NADPH2 dehydrogenase
MPGQDFLEGGLSIHDTLAVAEMLEGLGVHVIHVSSGIGGWRRPSTRVGEGYLVDEAAEFQARLHIPVIGVGGIETGDYIDRSLQTGRFSLAAVGRAILRDPDDWGRQQLLSSESRASVAGHLARRVVFRKGSI